MIQPAEQSLIQTQILKEKGLHSPDGTNPGYTTQLVTKGFFRRSHKETVLILSNKHNPVRVYAGGNILVEERPHRGIVSFCSSFPVGSRSDVGNVFWNQPVPPKSINERYVRGAVKPIGGLPRR